MVKTGVTLLAIALIVVGCGEAPPPDPAALISDATAALGAGDLDTIEYSGNGWDSNFGQAWSVQEDWTRASLTDYNRVIDYAAGTSRQTAERQVGMDPNKLGGGGAQPGAGPTNQNNNIAADAGFEQKLPIYMTPYGFLRLAATEDATVEAETMDGTRYNVLSFEVGEGDDVHRMRGYFNTDNFLEKVQTWLDNPVLGDMLVEVQLGDYQDVDGLMFPMHIYETRAGLGFTDLMVDSVTPNAVIEEPEQTAAGGRGGGRGGFAGGGRGGGRGGAGAGRGGGAAAPQEVSTRLGDGIWVVNGGYQGVIVEFAGYAAVIEGAQNADRSQLVISEAKRLTGDKPIRYYISTHTHFDHTGGIRDFVAEGATIIASRIDQEFWDMALNTPHALNPDLAQETGATATVMGVDDGFVLEDGTQRIELYQIQGSLHAADMMIAYLPSIRTIVEADLVQPWLGPQFGGPGHPFLVHLKGELDRLGLDYDQFVPVHAPTPPPTVARADFEAAAVGAD